MIGTFAEMNLSLKQMISLIWAAEKDVNLIQILSASNSQQKSSGWIQ